MEVKHKTSYVKVIRGSNLAPSEFNRMVNEDSGLSLHTFCVRLDYNTWQSNSCPNCITPQQQEKFIREEVTKWLKLNGYPADETTFHTKIVYCEY